MVAIAATNSATPSLQASLSQTRLQQARREADQAEAKAQNLRAQANTAESEAQRSQGRVRELSSSSAPTDPTYQVKRTPNIIQLHAATPLYSAQNTQGQATGRIINLRA